MSGPVDKELQAPDDLAAAIEPTYSRDEHDPDLARRRDDTSDSNIPLDEDYDAKNIGERDDSGSGNDEHRSSDDAPRPVGLTATKSYATDTSAATGRGPVPHVSENRPWYKKMNPLRWGGIPPVPEERMVSREAKAGFFSQLTWQWMTPLMTTGYKRQLDQRDIWSVNPQRAAEPLTQKFRESFNKRVQRGDKSPLFWALHETFAFEFWLGGLSALFATILQVISPFTLRYLIQFATDAWIADHFDRPAPHIANGIGLAIGITAMMVIQSFGISHFIYRGMMVGGQSRGILIGVIYEKAMVISGRARAGDSEHNLQAQATAEATAKDEKKKDKKAKKGAKAQEEEAIGWGNGRITNLMSVDTYRIDQASALFHITWTSPIALLITLALLLVNLSYNALAGFGLLVIGAPALAVAIKSLFRRRKDINKITDQRVSLTQEILQSVRFVKYFGWEEAFLGRLAEYRGREIYAIQILLTIRNAINAVSMALPIFASMLSFISYSLTNPNLPPAEIFSSLALFNGLRIPLNMMPLVLGQAIDAWSSMKRVQEFLLEEEEENSTIEKFDGLNAIELDNAAFTWEKSPATEGDKKDKKKEKKDKKKEKQADPAQTQQEDRPASSGKNTLVEEREPFKLQDLNLAIGRNELIAVIGSVGSGKSSLLSALAGDMRKTAGDVVYGASKAFCPQYAWIQNTTVRNNIVFGKDFNRSWYNDVVQACALQADMDSLPHGDATEIGERGITISGGQKQRLNIARAIYFDADIVLMDDPLSAVDAHVGRHIFDNAILGLLGNKCRILATHQLWVLSRCDRIVWMENGKIQAVDTFENLMHDNKGFQTLMETTDMEKKEEKKKDEDKVDEDDGKQQKKKKKGAALMQQEERAEFSVPWSVYASYIRSSGSILNAPLVVFILLLSQGANIMTSLWLSYWTSDKFGMSNGAYIGIYAGLGASQALFMYAYSVLLSILGTKSSKVMLRAAVTRVLRAPMSFFDTTPLGRITNRFSRDVDVMDNNLTDAIRMYSFTIAMTTSIFALIIAFFHFFAVALVPLYILFFFAAAYYRASAREVKRYESVLRSHVFAKFGEGLTGVASIKAYGLKKRFVDELREAIDEMNAAYFLTFSNQRWLSIRVDTIGNALVFVVGILVVTSRFSVDPSIGGLVLSYILAVVQMLQFGVRQLAEVENGMNAVERLQYYGTSLEEEAPLHTVDVRSSWPEKGEIVFDNVQMRYRENLPLVLQGLSMHVKGGERIGIVGRTGAGKSSIMSTLFRLVEISGGTITIDGINISTIGLHDLRSRLSIIPQDPTLFRGTVRSNLDPFHEHTDLELWSALRQADLVSDEAGPTDTTVPSIDAPQDNDTKDNDTKDNVVEEVSGVTPKEQSRIHLDTAVEEDGLNFSLGQRQLMALARALVRGSQIIVCDEATSSVDMETDAKIQNTIATGFRGRTLLCIAHRLRTIVGYDRICVMDAGQIAELDSPLELWKREGGIFRGMCDRSGIRLEDIKGAREEMLGGDLQAQASGSSS